MNKRKYGILYGFCLLSGCVVCQNIPDGNHGISYCISQSDYKILKDEGKESEYIFNVIKSDPKPLVSTSECQYGARGFINDYITNRRYCRTKSLSLEEWRYSEQEYIIKEAEKEKEELEWRKEKEKLQREEENRLTRLKKKSGVNWCQYRSFGELMEENRGTLPRNCMFEMPPALIVLQQTSAGTLVDLLGGGRMIYFIMKNQTDSRLVDREVVSEGIFVNVGAYSYTTPLGTKKTVHKLKRIE